MTYDPCIFATVLYLIGESTCLSKHMTLKKIAWIYLISYLAVGGIGFALFPMETQELFLSNVDYGDIMPRLVGAFMCLVSFLIFQMYRQEDWKYYPITIKARIPVVLFIFYLYYLSCNPMFLVINGIVILGLGLTIWGDLNSNSKSNSNK